MLSRLTYWHVRWLVPAAVVEAARRLAGDPVEGLRLIKQYGEPWMKNIAEELLINRAELQRILEDLLDGLPTEERLVDYVVEAVRRTMASETNGKKK